MHQRVDLTSDSPRRRGAMIAMLGVTAITIAVYAQMIGHGFVEIDDGEYVYENHHVLQGLTAEGFRWAWTTFHAANWHPLTWISHMADVTLFGLNPGAMKLHNLAMHVVNTWLVFCIIAALGKRTTLRPRGGAPAGRPLRGEDGDDGHQWCAVFCAAVFALHPLHVESVAWISERKDVLSAAFGLAALLVWIHHTRNPSRWRYAAMLGLFAASLMSKPMFVTLPCVLLLIDWWFPRTGKLRWVILEKVPMFAMAAASCVVTVFAQQQAVATLEHRPVVMRLGNAAVAYVHYLGKMFAPVNLTAIYPHPGHRPAWMPLTSLILLAAISYMARRWRVRRPHLLTGWLIFLGMLVPVIGIVQVGGQAYADRYMYLPMLGLLIAGAWTIDSAHHLTPHVQKLAKAACIAWLVALALTCVVQVADWRNGYTLFTAAIAKTERNTLAHNNLGVYLLHAGDVEGAAAEFESAVSISPEYVAALDNLAMASLELGRLARAEHAARTALVIKPESPAARLTLARAALAKGDKAAALAEARLAVASITEQFPLLYSAADVLFQAGDADGSIAALRVCLNLNPRYAPAWFALGAVLNDTGKREEAMAAMRQAQQLDPDSPMVAEKLRQLENPTGD